MLAPMKPQLAGARELTIVPDGPLHYVPFGTMRDPPAEQAVRRAELRDRVRAGFAPGIATRAPRPGRVGELTHAAGGRPRLQRGRSAPVPHGAPRVRNDRID